MVPVSPVTLIPTRILKEQVCGPLGEGLLSRCSVLRRGDCIHSASRHGISSGVLHGVLSSRMGHFQVSWLSRECNCNWLYQFGSSPLLGAMPAGKARDSAQTGYRSRVKSRMTIFSTLYGKKKTENMQNIQSTALCE